MTDEVTNYFVTLQSNTAAADSHLIAARGTCHNLPQAVSSPFFTYFMVYLCHPLDFFIALKSPYDSVTNGVKEMGTSMVDNSV